MARLRGLRKSTAKCAKRPFKKKPQKQKPTTYEMRVWKKIFFLPADPTWYAVINAICIISSCCYIYYATSGMCIAAVPFKSEFNFAVFFFFSLNSLSRFELISGVFFIMELFYTADIIVSILVLYVPGIDFRYINITGRPLWMLCLEIVSLFPLEMFFPYKTLRQRIILCTTRLNRCFRLIKVYYFFRQYWKLVDCASYLRLIEMYVNMIVVGLTTFMLYCNLHLFKDQLEGFCTDSTIIMIFSKITTSSYAEYPSVKDIPWDATMTFAGLLSCLVITMLTMCHLILYNVDITYVMYRFTRLYRADMDLLKDCNVPEYIIRTLKNSMVMLWEKCGGYNENPGFLRYMPFVMKNEVLFDICWSAFQHSNLFRNEDTFYLRHLSRIMQQRFFMPGEFIFKKNEFKSKMVYVVSGTVELLSEDDGESAILSFCNGTCIGESSLLVSYRSKNYVCCKTFCELHIIEKSDFIKMGLEYPELYHHFRKIISKRYRQAKYTKKLANFAKNLISDSQRAKDTYTIIWMKNTLHRLMSIDRETTARHKMQNIYLLYDIETDIFDKMLFCADYVDLLAIKERHEAEKDTVFVKTSFPCILQPSSIIVYINETFVIITTIVVSCILPIISFVQKDTPDHMYLIISVVTFSNWVDIYIQLSTGINTRHGMISRMKSIAVLKLKNIGFWCDIISCIPAEVFSTVFVETITNQNKGRLRLNRLAKIYRIYHLFKKWEIKLNFNAILIRYLKFIWIYAYFTFLSVCIFIWLHPKMNLDTIYFCAVQVITTVGIKQGDLDDLSRWIFLFDALSYLLRLIMMADVISAYLVYKIPEMMSRQMASRILTKVKRHKVSENYQQRVFKFLSTQNLYKAICKDRQHFLYLAEMPKSLRDDSMEYLLSELLKSHVFFQIFPDECLREIYSIMNIMILPSNEAIIYAGDMSSNVYIVWLGNVTTYDVNGQLIRITSGYRVINLIPAIFTTSAVMSYVTATDCRIVTFDINRFKKVLIKYPKYLEIFNRALALSGDISEKLAQYAQYEMVADITPLLKVKEKSFYYFGFNQKPHSFEEFDYFVPFDRLYPLEFIKVFLMRFTIMPEGPFIKVWEAFRCFFAVLLTLLVFTYPIYTTRFTYLIAFLDITAFVDLYVRFHVCYYNEYGILVKHPMKTAIHYATHGFLIDFIAAFPFKYLYLTDYRDVDAFFITHLNCLLQLHRYVQFFNMVRKRSILLLSNAHSITFLPLMLVAVNFLGSILMKSECNFDAKDEVSKTKGFIGTLNCKNDSVLANSPFAKPIGTWRAHLYGTYIFAGLITTIGWQGFEVKRFNSRIFVSIVSYVGLFSTAIIMAYIVSVYIFRLSDLLIYQRDMRHLKEFMNKVNVTKKLKKYIINNCEKQWAYSQREPLAKTLKPLYNTLQLDILYESYGRKGYNYSVFPHKNKNFYRNILNYSEIRFCMKNDYIASVNEITKYFVILLDGIVQVVGPDGVTLQTLYPGSLFGNLEGAKYYRYKNTLIASTHAELLITVSKKFHEILNYYPHMVSDFNRMKSINISYIPSSIRYIYIEEAPTNVRSKLNCIFDHTFNPDSRGMQIWRWFILIFTCYFGIILDFYQLGSGDFAPYVMAVQYISDGLYAIDYLLRNRVAYEDHRGTMVMDLKKIKMKNQEQRIMNVMPLISLLPIDAMIIVYPISWARKGSLVGLFRLTRLLRLIYILDLFKRLSEKLNVHIMVIRTLYILFLVSLYLTGIAALTATVSCSFNLNMHPHIPTCESFYSVLGNRTEVYIKLVHIATSSLTFGSNKSIYPEGVFVIILFILFMLAGFYLHGLCLGVLFGTIIDTYGLKYFYKSVLNRLRFFMKMEDLSRSLVDRVNYCMTLLWHESDATLEQTILIGKLGYLRDAIYYDAFHYRMRDHPLFKNCHRHCVRQIIYHLKFRPFFTGSYIQLEGTRCERMYILIYGKVAVIENVYENFNNIVHVFENSGFFGVKAGLYTKYAYKHTYRSLVRNTYVAYLDRKDWIHILDFFPASKQMVYDAARNYIGY